MARTASAILDQTNTSAWRELFEGTATARRTPFSILRTGRGRRRNAARGICRGSKIEPRQIVNSETRVMIMDKIKSNALVPAEANRERKAYQKPRILSVEMLEVVAATCDFSKTEPEGFGNPCGANNQPLNS